MLFFQIQRVASQKHVDDEFWNVCSLLLVGLFLVIGRIDHVLDVIFVPLKQIFGLENLLSLAVIMRMLRRVYLYDLLVMLVVVRSASFLHGTPDLTYSLLRDKF
jgi:hypothetical protein